MKGINSFLPILTGILIGLNFYLLLEFPPEVHRWGRIACSGFFTLLLITRRNNQNALLIGSMLLFLMADMFALRYDYSVPQQAFFALQSMAYLLMLIQIRKSIRKPNTSGYERWFFTGVFLVNLCFVFIIGNVLSDEVNDPLLEVLFYLYGLSSILLISAGILYYDTFSDNKSTAYLWAGLALVFSNVTGFSAHFLEYHEFFYLNRLLYVTGIASLVYFCCTKQVRSPKDDLLKNTDVSPQKFYHQGDIDLLDK